MHSNSPVYQRFDLPFPGAKAEDCLVILHTNDLHGSVDAGLAEPSAGFAHVKALKDYRQGQFAGVLLLDGGDTLHGRAEVHPSQGGIPMEMMVAAGYDAMVPGNHDFNYGKDQLLRLHKRYGLPIVAANILMTASRQSFLPPSLVVEVGGWKVGLFGIASLETITKASPRHIAGLCLVDPVLAGREAVAKLRAQGVDVVVCLSHLGMDKVGPIQDNHLARQVDGIDVIIGGHSHSVLEEGLWEGTTLICQAGSYFSHVGEVRIGRDETGRLRQKAVLHTNDAMRTVRPHVDILHRIEDLGLGGQAKGTSPLGEIPAPLIGDRLTVRTQETNFGRLMADLIREETGADFAMMNGGGIRAGVSQGPVTKSDVKRAFPFTNYSVLLEVSGKDLVEVLEYGLAAYPQPAGRFPHISGGRLAFDPKKPAGQRIQRMEIGGKPLRLDQTFTFAINDFVAFGGDGYDNFHGRSWLDYFSPLAELFEGAIRAGRVRGDQTLPRIVALEA